jgi:hypothetical protein
MKKYSLCCQGLRLGIYRLGGGYIVNPEKTLFFNFEVVCIFLALEKVYSDNDRLLARDYLGVTEKWTN